MHGNTRTIACLYIFRQIKIFSSMNRKKGGHGLCLYFDGWLNACVAIERTVNVSKGVKFDKKMSRRMARRMIFILLTLILGSLIHEPIQHDLFTHTIPK